MDIEQARKTMKHNFIGPDELKKIAGRMNLPDFHSGKVKIPAIQFKVDLLKKVSEDYILILGLPRAKDGTKLTINNLRLFFGFDPAAKEPCFYNQDWYLKEKFANDVSLKFKWYLIKKTVAKNSRGRRPEDIEKSLPSDSSFPSAVLTVFTFFAYYFLSSGRILWQYDFIWCSDKDKNGDRIYTGRYSDPKKINKNGF